MDRRPAADEWRERTAREVFSDWMKISPEEWVAKYSHTVACSSFNEYRYADAKLDYWIQRIHLIMLNQAEISVAECRQKFLTQEDIQRIKDYEF